MNARILFVVLAIPLMAIMLLVGCPSGRGTPPPPQQTVYTDDSAFEYANNGKFLDHPIKAGDLPGHTFESVPLVGGITDGSSIVIFPAATGLDGAGHSQPATVKVRSVTFTTKSTIGNFPSIQTGPVITDDWTITYGSNGRAVGSNPNPGGGTINGAVINRVDIPLVNILACTDAYWTFDPIATALCLVPIFGGKTVSLPGPVGLEKPIQNRLILLTWQVQYSAQLAPYEANTMSQSGSFYTDSDRDGWPDFIELEVGTNPYDASSHPVRVPCMIGETDTFAESALELAGLQVNRLLVSNSNVAPGIVFAQSYGCGGTDTLVPSGTTIVIEVASGPTVVTVPCVVGDDKTTAQNVITAAGFVPNLVVVTDSNVSQSDIDKVFAQTPACGQTAVPGSTITIEVKELPPPNPLSATFTLPANGQTFISSSSVTEALSITGGTAPFTVTILTPNGDSGSFWDHFQTNSRTPSVSHVLTSTAIPGPSTGVIYAQVIDANGNQFPPSDHPEQLAVTVFVSVAS